MVGAPPGLLSRQSTLSGSSLTRGTFFVKQNTWHRCQLGAAGLPRSFTLSPTTGANGVPSRPKWTYKGSKVCSAKVLQSTPTLAGFSAVAWMISSRVAA